MAVYVLHISLIHCLLSGPILVFVMQLPGNFIVSPNPCLGGRPFLAFNVGSATAAEESRLVDDRGPDVPRLTVAIVARSYGLR